LFLTLFDKVTFLFHAFTKWAIRGEHPVLFFNLFLALFPGHYRLLVNLPIWNERTQ